MGCTRGWSLCRKFNSLKLVRLFIPAFLIVVIPVALSAHSPVLETQQPEVRVGERLFSESRFARFFQANSGGRVNDSLSAGDPALDTLVLPDAKVIRGPYAGQTMSCRTCHLSGELKGQAGLPAQGITLFGDLVGRSSVTERDDGQRTSPRHAPPLVGALITQPGGWGLLHWDGEFASTEDLVEATFTGRNLGWLPAEHAEAVRHFARVIREDDGAGALAKVYAPLPYAVLLRGVDPAIPPALRLPASFRLDPTHASDEAILRGCARLVTSYLATLQFSHDAQGQYNGSPYDAFLAANRLPRTPQSGETPPEYNRRLSEAVAALRAPRYIDEPARKFSLHNQPFRFTETELIGLKIFLRGAVGVAQSGGAGNCAECHLPPHFSDFAFHNTGVSQDEHDAAHGAGAFVRLEVPDLATRSTQYDHWLPATPQHPGAKSIFRSPVAVEDPARTDLGLWNIYANPDFPAAQTLIEHQLNRGGQLTHDKVLGMALARFKTPTIRDLGQKSPYFHNGKMQTIEEVIRFYQKMSRLAHAGQMRNAPPEYFNMRIADGDIQPLAAYLRSLDEDYGGD